MMTQDADKKREQIQMLCMDDMVPQDHLLRIIDKAINWNFIYDLVEEKYSKYEWNIGKSPKGKNRFDGRFDFGTLTLNFNAIDGKIQNAHISGDFFSIRPIEELCQKLNGVEIKKEDLIKAFFNIKEYVAGACADEIVNGLF